MGEGLLKLFLFILLAIAAVALFAGLMIVSVLIGAVALSWGLGLLGIDIVFRHAFAVVFLLYFFGGALSIRK